MLAANGSGKALRPHMIRLQQPDIFTLYDVRYLRDRSVTRSEALCKDERRRSSRVCARSVCDQPTGEPLKKNGGARRDRTDDLKLAKLALSQLSYGPELHRNLCPSRRTPSEMVGLGRLELPTSRLSSARSNQLSYKPDPPHIASRSIAASKPGRARP